MAADRKVRLVANDSQKFGSRQLRPGDKFSASPPDADDVLAMGYARKDLTAEDDIANITAPPEPVPKKKRGSKPGAKRGKYKRKDLRAET